MRIQSASAGRGFVGGRRRGGSVEPSGASHEHQDNEDYQDDDEHPAADVDPAVADKCCD